MNINESSIYRPLASLTNCKTSYLCAELRQYIWRRGFVLELTMATQQLGRMQEFEPDTESISAYLERLQLFFEANDIADGKKVSVLLTVIGRNNFSLLRNLLAPDSPKDKSLDDLTEVLKAHFEPKPLVIAERFNFYRRNQRSEESILDFVADLRRLTVKCEFGAFLDQALRDRFVCGLKSENMQKHLLAKDHIKLTFSKAVETAQGMEAAASKAKEFKEPPPAVFQVTPRQKPCHRCGRSNHDEQACRFRQATCHNCGKVGHIAPACRSRKTSKRSIKRKPADTAHWVELETSELETSEPEEMAVYTVGEKATNPIKVDVLINGRSFPMELDTGAAVTIIPDTTRKAIFPTARLQHSSVNLRTYTGEPIQVVGELLVNVQYCQQEVKQLPLTVVKGDGPALLGRNWLQHIRLDWKMIKKVTQQPDPKKSLESLLDKYKEVFQEELGHISDFKARLLVRENAKPKFFKPRSVPFAMKAAVEEELSRLEQIGVVEKISSSEWAAPIVAVPKKDGKVRLCGDYKVTINPALDVDQYPLPVPEALFATLSGGKNFTTLDLSQAY